MADKIVHTIHLDRYAPMPAQIQLGTVESYGVEQIAIVAGAGWDGLDIVAVYHPPKAAEPVRVLVPSDGLSDVPPEATASAGRGALVIAGMADGVQIASCNIAYTVIAQAGTDGTTSDAPTPDLVQQILSAAHGAVKTADGVRADMDKVLEAESGRETAEADRVAAESERVKAEAARAEAEADRAAAEKERQTAEGTRIAAEQSRVKAENARATAETARAEAETKRASAEQERQTAEQGRITAESARVEAEAEREKQLPALSSAVDELQVRQNILIGSETGNPVTVDDAFAAPLCGLTIYGKSTQDGTPTPDAPVPIVSAGDGGSVTVKVTGANVLEGTKPGVKSTVYGVTYTTYKNGVLITGTATANFSMALHKDTIHRLTRGIYYLTASGLSPSVTINFYFIGRFSSDLQNQEVILTRDVDFSLRLEVLKGATVNTTVQVALTRNKIAAYSPYHEQLLTLPTPNGLPGIPVTSGGNYTDPSGQQWVCDEVDLAREVMVQRIDKAALDDTKPLAEQNATLATPIETPLTADEIAAYKALTAYAPDTVVQASDGAGIRLGYQRDVNLVVKNLEDAVASMTTT